MSEEILNVGGGYPFPPLASEELVKLVTASVGRDNVNFSYQSNSVSARASSIKQVEGILIPKIVPATEVENNRAVVQRIQGACATRVNKPPIESVYFPPLNFNNPLQQSPSNCRDFDLFEFMRKNPYPFP